MVESIATACLFEHWDNNIRSRSGFGSIIATSPHLRLTSPHTIRTPNIEKERVRVPTKCHFSRLFGFLRFLDGPSYKKGSVTTPTVKIFNSLAALAITCAAPVPVPPPIPAVIKTMFAP